jgi:hypothetical protein
MNTATPAFGDCVGCDKASYAECQETRHLELFTTIRSILSGILDCENELKTQVNITLL